MCDSAPALLCSAWLSRDGLREQTQRLACKERVSVTLDRNQKQKRSRCQVDFPIEEMCFGLGCALTNDKHVLGQDR